MEGTALGGIDQHTRPKPAADRAGQRGIALYDQIVIRHRVARIAESNAWHAAVS